MCSICRDPRREEYTICTARAPDAVFTVRTYATDPPYDPDLVPNRPTDETRRSEPRRPPDPAKVAKSGPQFDDAHFVGPREVVGQVRDRIISILEMRGSKDAVDGLKIIADARPQELWLHRVISEAETRLHEFSWRPLDCRQLGLLARSARACSIRSLPEFRDFILEGLTAIQASLRSDTPDAPLALGYPFVATQVRRRAFRLPS